jgi:hypothetical protein
VVILAVAVLVAVGALTAVPSVLGLIMACVSLGAATPLAVARVRGRTLDQWVPALAGWGSPWPGRRRQWRSALPGRGQFPGEASAADPPPPLRGVVLLRARRQGHHREVAVARDTRAGTWTAVLSCRGRAFGLCDPDEQERLAAAWGEALASFA